MVGPPGKRKRPNGSEPPSPSAYRHQDGMEHPSNPFGGQRGRHNDNYRGQRRSSRGHRAGGSASSSRGAHGPRSGNRNAGNISASQTFSTPPVQGPARLKDQPAAAEQRSQPANEIDLLPSSQPVQRPASAEPHEWKILTDEIITNWDTTGKDAVLEAGARACYDPLLFGTVVQELLKAGLDDRLSPLEAGKCLKVILTRHNNEGNESSASVQTGDTVNENLMEGVVSATEEAQHHKHDLQSLFLDSISNLADADTENPNLRPLLMSSEVPVDMMRAFLEPSLLARLGLVRDTFYRIGIRKTTNSLYRQNNYNLLREETEGYSKLITELYNTSGNNRMQGDFVEETFQKVLSLIGAFDLDVGRVLDVTLDVFAAVLVRQYRFFVKFLRASSWWPKRKQARGWNVDDVTPEALPVWALPASMKPELNQKQDQLGSARMLRDQKFWDRASEIGIAAFLEIGGRRASAQTLERARKENDADGEADKWIQVTGTIPPNGNRVAAQLLGFKLRFYTSSARDSDEVMPENLISLAALLIKIGFISLHDLIAHLSPSADEAEEIREAKMKEKAEREAKRRPGGGVPNALMNAGALPDDRKPPPESTFLPTTDKSVVELSTVPKKGPLPIDQKMLLLRSLLCLGAIPEALYILSSSMWLLDAYPDLVEHLHRIYHHSLHKVSDSLRPNVDLGQLSGPKEVPELGPFKGQLRTSILSPRKVMKWTQIDRIDKEGGTDYKFYWDEWADTVPVCQTKNDVLTLCTTLIKYSGVRIGKDNALLVKLARIGKQHLAEDSSKLTWSRWIDVSKRLIVPALSLSQKAPGVVNEVFDLIKVFPMTTRYSIYAEWYFGSVSRIPEIVTAFSETRLETKDVLKRISTTTVKPMARALAKAAHSSPGIVFNTAFSQMETYDNLTETFVECARYLTALSYDVLVWSLMNALGGSGRSRLQADGILTSKWLQVLSDFTGKLFKRYNVVHCTPILQYVSDQLRKSSPVDLVVLSAIISEMSGILTEENLSEDQILSLAGGEHLRRRVHSELLDKRYESKSGAKRLTKALVDSSLVGPLLISIAQTRQTCVFNFPNDPHLKVLGNVFDEIHAILVKYLNLLWDNLTHEELRKLIPSVDHLVRDFGLEPKIAFYICRPMITSELAETDALAQKEAIDGMAESKIPAEAEEVIIIKVDEVSSTNTTSGDSGENAMAIDRVQSSGATPIEISADDGKGDSVLSAADGTSVISSEHVAGGGATESLNQSAKPQDIFTPLTNVADGLKKTPEPEFESSQIQLDKGPTSFNPVLQIIMDSMGSVRSQDRETKLSTSFYVVFWQASLFDVWDPQKTYLDVLMKVTKEIGIANADRSDMSSAGRERRESLKKQLNETSTRLKGEMEKQHATHLRNRDRLLEGKNLWFDRFTNNLLELNVALLEECFLPRMIISPVDAVYCFRLIKLLHTHNTQNFRTLWLLDQLFRHPRIANIIFMCSSREAENLGVFLKDLLEDLARWHARKTTYETEAIGSKRDLRGFAKKVRGEKAEIHLGHDEFRTVLFKWHRNLSNSLIACLEGDEYMHIRNALFIMKAVQKSFPAVDWMGQKLLTGLEKIYQNDEREDLKLAARSLYGSIKPRSSTWLAHHQFRPSERVAQIRLSPKPPVESSVASVDEAEPRDVAKSLDATAAEFKPADNSTMPEKDGTEKPKNREIEDGEINDLKSKSAKAGSPPPKVVQNETPPMSKVGESTSVEVDQEKLKKSEPAQKERQNNETNSKPQTQSTLQLPTKIASSHDKHVPDVSKVKSHGATANIPNKPSPNLPGRPEPFRHPDRFPNRGSQRESYGPPHDLNRPLDESTNENGRDRRGLSPPRRPQDGASDRSHRSQWEKPDPGWSTARPYDSRGDFKAEGRRHPGREEWDPRAHEWTDVRPRDRYLEREGFQDNRGLPPQGRLPRESNMASSRSGSFPHNTSYSETVPLLSIDHRGDLRHQRELRERISRPPSPRADDSRQDLSVRPPQPNEDRYQPSDPSRAGRSRKDGSSVPTGPKSEREVRSNVNDNPLGNGRGRELFAASLPNSRSNDSENGRLSRESTHGSRQQQQQQDPNFGRLRSSTDSTASVRGAASSKTTNTRDPQTREQAPNKPDANEQDSRSRRSPAIEAKQGTPPTGPSNRQNRRGEPGESSSVAPNIPTGPAKEGLSSESLTTRHDNRSRMSSSGQANRAPLERGAPPPAATSSSNATPSAGLRVADQTTLRSESGNAGSRQGPQGYREKGNNRQFQDLQNVLQQSAGSERSDRANSNARDKGNRQNGANGHSDTSAPPPRRRAPLEIVEQKILAEAVLDKQPDNRRRSGRDGDRRNGRQRSPSPRYNGAPRVGDNASRGGNAGRRGDSSRAEERHLNQGGERTERELRRDDGRPRPELRNRTDTNVKDDQRRDEPNWRQGEDNSGREENTRGNSRRREGRDSARDGGSGRKRPRQTEELLGDRGPSDTKRPRR